jgi:hypothetical protein
MTRRNKILDFRRHHRIEKPPKPPVRLRRRKRLGEETDDRWGPYYWPYGLRTWVLITGLGPPILLGIAWLFGWGPGIVAM